MEINKIIHENCLTGLKNMESKSVDCCVTSPPYYGLRDYGNSAQIGLENTPEKYISNLVAVFHEVNRVLKDEGTLWLNIADSYAGSGKGFNSDGSYGKCGEKQKSNTGTSVGSLPDTFISKSKRNVDRYGGGNLSATGDLKPKDLIGIPWMLAFALRADGWYLRQDIIWAKPNPMPESVTDRCTKSHEYIFLLSKSAKYYYDAEAIKTDLKDSSIARITQDTENQTGSARVPGKTNGNMKAVRFGGNKGDGNIRSGIYSGNDWKPKGYEHRGEGDKKLTGHSGNYDASGNLIGGGRANKKSVWTVTTRPYSEAHFATFPERLIIPCIKAGCQVGGTVLDPFMGAGTTALVARKLERNFIGFELNEKYIKIAEKRLRDELGMFI